MLTNQTFLYIVAGLIFLVAAYLVVRRLLKVTFPYFFLGLTGLILGLIIGSLIGGILTDLPGNYGKLLPLTANVVVAVGIFELFLTQSERASDFISLFLRRGEDKWGLIDVVVDTSVLIDGRIQAIVETGFLPGTLVVPQIVLKELQALADSRDDLKRAKGRRGLEVLTGLRDQPTIKINIFSEKSEESTVDAELVRIAEKRHAYLLTLDYNLNQIAHIKGIRVLNINALANSLKPTLLPGETLMVAVIQVGKEPGQGVGYLPDGTMIIVEGGDEYVDQEVECEVDRIYQTLSGKIVFVSIAKHKRQARRVIEKPRNRTVKAKSSVATGDRLTIRDRLFRRTSTNDKPEEK